jgi:DNA-directed RNA polymerase subunit RPC12/RpoP
MKSIDWAQIGYQRETWYHAPIAVYSGTIVPRGQCDRCGRALHGRTWEQAPDVYLCEPCRDRIMDDLRAMEWEVHIRRYTL